MSDAAKLIDLSQVQGPVLTGRDRGEQLRAKFNLDALDAAGAVVDVTVPDTTYAITSSFFLGMFVPSVKHAGSKEAFYSHFRFKAPEFLLAPMDDFVSRALQPKNLFA